MKIWWGINSPCKSKITSRSSFRSKSLGCLSGSGTSRGSRTHCRCWSGENQKDIWRCYTKTERLMHPRFCNRSSIEAYHAGRHIFVLLAHDPRDADVLFVRHGSAPVDVLWGRFGIFQLDHNVSILVLDLALALEWALFFGTWIPIMHAGIGWSEKLKWSTCVGTWDRMIGPPWPANMYECGEVLHLSQLHNLLDSRWERVVEWNNNNNNNNNNNENWFSFTYLERLVVHPELHPTLQHGWYIEALQSATKWGLSATNDLLWHFGEVPPLLVPLKAFVALLQSAPIGHYLLRHFVKVPPKPISGTLRKCPNRSLVALCQSAPKTN